MSADFNQIAGIMVRLRVVTDEECRFNPNLQPGNVVAVRVDCGRIVAQIKPEHLFSGQGNRFEGI